MRLFPRFLEDDSEYVRASNHWKHLWHRIPKDVRLAYRWQHPWLEEEPPGIRDGNPIFTAVTPEFRKAIRIIQAPTTYDPHSVDFFAWIDTFGGDFDDPAAIIELVISCVLTTVTSTHAFGLMEAWVLSAASVEIPILFPEAFIPEDARAAWSVPA